MSLIELMIAMLIGIILLGGATTMFMTNKRVYKEQNEMGLLQENARFTMELLAYDIRMAGYVGCHADNAQVTNNLNNSDAATHIYNFSRSIEGSESAANWAPSNSADNVANMVSGTDGITIRYFQPFNTRTTQDMSTNTDDINVAADRSIRENDMLAISDCASADIFQNSKMDSSTGLLKLQRERGGTATPGNSTKAVSKSYPSGSTINRIIARRYFICDIGKRPASTPPKRPALCWSHANAPAPKREELVEGVESMQILYGVDTSNNGAVNTYVKADAVTNWDNIISVKIALLMRTIEEYGETTDNNTYDLLGETAGPFNDRRRRRIFSTTIQVRNGAST